MKIAITGLAGSGKDTVAEILAKILGDTTVVALADLPKEMAAKHFDMPLDWFYDRDIKDTMLGGGPSPRERLVTWFDELFAEHGDDYSLQMNKKKIATINTKHVIISDIRYPIEFDWIEDEDMMLLNIKRNVDATINHKTEQGTHKGIIIDNNGTIEELEKYLRELFHLHINNT